MSPRNILMAVKASIPALQGEFAGFGWLGSSDARLDQRFAARTQFERAHADKPGAPGLRLPGARGLQPPGLCQYL
jgi:hypothetical protein